jgi:hypothetical protein
LIERRNVERQQRAAASLGNLAEGSERRPVMQDDDARCLFQQRIGEPAGVDFRLFEGIADALRDAPGPMTTKELARHVMAERGLNTADVSLLQLFTRRTGALLRDQKKRGILRSMKDPQHGRFDLWEIAV